MYAHQLRTGDHFKLLGFEKVYKATAINPYGTSEHSLSISYEGDQGEALVLDKVAKVEFLALTLAPKSHHKWENDILSTLPEGSVKTVKSQAVLGTAFMVVAFTNGNMTLYSSTGFQSDVSDFDPDSTPQELAHLLTAPAEWDEGAAPEPEHTAEYL